MTEVSEDDQIRLEACVEHLESIEQRMLLALVEMQGETPDRAPDDDVIIEIMPHGKNL